MICNCGHSAKEHEAVLSWAIPPGDMPNACQTCGCRRYSPNNKVGGLRNIINRLYDVKRDVFELLEDLAAQQAMTDDSWRTRWAEIEKRLDEVV